MTIEKTTYYNIILLHVMHTRRAIRVTFGTLFIIIKCIYTFVINMYM